MHFLTPLDERSSKEVFFYITLFLFLSNSTTYAQKRPNLGQNFLKSVNYPPIITIRRVPYYFYGGDRGLRSQHIRLFLVRTCGFATRIHAFFIRNLFIRN